MVLGYTESGIAAKNLPAFVDPTAPPFSPTSVPTVTDNWVQVLQMPGVLVGGSHPYLDPSGYRSRWVDVQDTRTAWGLTILQSAPNRENAVRFLQLLLAPGEIGQTTLEKVGPSPASPAVVSPSDMDHVPAELQNLVPPGDPLTV